jgi:hypothetical protein
LLVQRVVKENLGFYTAEQEADDFSLEQLSALGISPNHAIEGQFQMAEKKYKEDSKEFVKRQGTTPDKFRKIVKGNMIDPATGKFFFPLIGDLDNLHHNSIYRIYNFIRESKIHKYPLNDKTTVVKKDWSTIHQESTQLLEKVRPQPMRTISPLSLGQEISGLD